MSDLRRAGALLGLLLATAAPAAAERMAYDVFPASSAVFAQPIADPRRIALSASYYRLFGQDTADVALGHSWAMARWYTHDDFLTWQWDVEGMAYSRFTLSGTLNAFETVDFNAGLPVEVRHDGFSARAMIFHRSSHLGDDYIRRTGDQGFRYSVDGLSGQASLEPKPWARVYGGFTYLLHTMPSPARRAAQAGFELTSRPIALSRADFMRLFLAQDFQSQESVHWNVNSRTLAGAEIHFKTSPHYMRVYGGAFDGHSPFGQFFSRRERFLEIGISFHL